MRLAPLIALCILGCTVQDTQPAETVSFALAAPKVCDASSCATICATAKDMRPILTATLACAISLGCSCPPIPEPQPPSPSSGGQTASGGTSAGGSSSGGLTSSGGSVPVGGSSTVVPPIKWLACNSAKKAAHSVKRRLSGWHKSTDRAKHRRLKPTYSLVAGSVFNQVNLATPLDQGGLGACTGNGVAQCLSTSPFAGKLTEANAVAIYSLATTLDPFPGAYPPTDTGSNGESAAVAAKQLGFTTLEFGAVDSIEGLQVALQRSACIIGVNWYDGFFNPTACGEMKLTGSLAGGHEVEVLGWDADRKIFIIRNSWGADWGNCRDGAPDECGYAYWSAGTLQTLLNRGAEIDCPVL